MYLTCIDNVLSIYYVYLNIVSTHKSKPVTKDICYIVLFFLFAIQIIPLLNLRKKHHGFLTHLLVLSSLNHLCIVQSFIDSFTRLTNMYWAPIMFSELGWALGYKKMGFLLSGSFLLEFSTYSSQDHYAALPKDNVLLIFVSSLLGRGISWHGLLFWPVFQGPEAMHVSISLSPQRMRPEGSSQPLFYLTHREATQKSPPRMLGS